MKTGQNASEAKRAERQVYNLKNMTIQDKLNQRIEQHAFRSLKLTEGMVDFCSNDYLGIATNNLLSSHSYAHGAGGSRLLSGNYSLVEKTEKKIADFHHAEAGLIFNSGYDANVGLLSCLAQKGDTYIYDKLSHASIRDGMRLSFAHSISFDHNDTQDLEKKLKNASGEIYVITESVFSMDGDMAPLQSISQLCKKYKAHLIVDEAHATGVIGDQGEGLVRHLGLQDQCFARIHTFGKACGAHGAIILGSKDLRDYLINFSRAFIYTTALPPSSIASISHSYDLFPGMEQERLQLQELIHTFRHAFMAYEKLESITPIQGVVVPGNIESRKLAESIQQSGLDVRPILYPTVPQGKERLRIVLHSFNTKDQLQKLVNCLS